MRFYVVYIPITPICYCPREVVVGNKVEHAHYIRFIVVRHAQYIISRPTSERADITV
jgi:hypothetical protein